MATFFNDLANKINGLSSREIEGILHILLNKPGISNNKLIQLTGLPKETLKNFKKAASFLLQDTNEDAIFIRESYLSQLKSANPKAFAWTLLSLDENQQLVQKLAEFRAKHKLAPKRELDQFFATVQTSVAKALILTKKATNLLAPVAVLGDDDMVSTCIQLANFNKTAVTVFEVDDKLLSYLKTANEELGINNVKYVKYDAKNELSPQFFGKFSVVVTDPPYTKQGLTLFLNRAIQLLNLKTGGYIFLYYGTSQNLPEKVLTVQHIITQMGLVIEDRIAGFARYNGAESIGSTSDLYILKTTPKTIPVKQIAHGLAIYSNQNAKAKKFPYVEHYNFKLYGVPKQNIATAAVQKLTTQFCKIHKLKVLDNKVTKFAGGGMTITYVLASSNLTLHTWPELSAIHVDLITCTPIYNREQLGATLHGLFKCNEVEVLHIE